MPMPAGSLVHSRRGEEGVTTLTLWLGLGMAVVEDTDSRVLLMPTPMLLLPRVVPPMLLSRHLLQLDSRGGVTKPWWGQCPGTPGLCRTSHHITSHRILPAHLEQERHESTAPTQLAYPAPHHGAQ